MRDDDCVRFLKATLPDLGLRWAGYRKVRGTVCKRVRRRVRALGLLDLDAYRARIVEDPAERAALDALCRIPISRFWRDREVFDALAGTVLPDLAARGANHIDAWSCGAASGEEPYSLAILWRALDTETGLRVLATDVDPHVLERARRGCYAPGSLKELPPELRERAFAPEDGLLCVRPEFRAGVTFRLQDVRRELPGTSFDLILCRNVVFTYFAPGLQARTLERIVSRLRPGGWLVIGRQERLPFVPAGLEPLAADLPIWRRAA